MASNHNEGGATPELAPAQMTDAHMQDNAAPLWQAVARAPARPESWLALARHYAPRDLPWQAAYAARQALRLEPAAATRLQELGIDPGQCAAGGDARLGRAS